MATPLACCEGLDLVNSMLKNSPTAAIVKDFKKKRRLFDGRGVAEDSMMNMGKGCWSAFLRRNRDKLVTACGTHLDVNRAKWKTHANFKMICELIYEQFVEAGIGRESAQTKMCDGEGNVVDKEDLMVGLPTKCEIVHPVCLLIVDEVGLDLHCDNGNNVGGENMFLELGVITPQLAATTTTADSLFWGLQVLIGSLQCVQRQTMLSN